MTLSATIRNSARTARVIALLGIALLPAFMCLSGCGQNHHGPQADASVRVSMPTSMVKVFQALNELAAKEIDIAIVPLVGPSGGQVDQIIAGSPCDVVVTDHRTWMDKLAEQNLLVDQSRSLLATNELVLAVRKDAPAKPQIMDELTGAGFHPIAMGNPEFVAVGLYAKQALERTMIWSQLQRDLVLAPSAADVVDDLITGKGVTGLVYASDVQQQPQLETVFTLNAVLHDPIRIEMARLRDAQETETARRLMIWLAEPKAQAVLAKYGFGPNTD